MEKVDDQASADAAVEGADAGVENAEASDTGGGASTFVPPFQVFRIETSAVAHSQAAIDAGGVVSIDGRVVSIEGSQYYNYYYDTLDGVRNELGYDVLIFQTCVDDREAGSVIVYYGNDANGSGPYAIW